MITAVISTYNHAIFLESCISAISAQGDLITKIIVINDASTDHTELVLAGIKNREPRLFVVTNKQNLGAVGGFKVGLKHVETEFFSLLAADDFLMPGWAINSVSALRGSEMASVCLSNTYVKDEDTGFITCTKIPICLTNRYLSPKKFCESVIKYGVWYSSNTALFRTARYDENSFQSNLGPLNDRLMISALGSSSGVVIVDGKFGCFYVRKKSMSGSVASRNMSLSLLKSFSDYLFRSNLFVNVDKKFLSKVFLSTFYIYINEHLEFMVHQYKNVLCDMPYKQGVKVNIFFLSIIKIFFKITFTLINKSFSLMIHEWFSSSRLSDKEIKYVNDYEYNIKQFNNFSN